VRGGDRISLHYDPMIAKLIVWDETRELALGRLAAGLREFEVGGVHTNVEFLAAIAAHPAYQSLDLDTGFIARHAETLLPGDAPADATVLALAALALLLRARSQARTLAARGPDPHSPWRRIDGWRLHEPHQYTQPLRERELQRLVTIRIIADEFEITVPGHAAMRAQRATLDGPELQVALDGARRRAVVIEDGAAIDLLCDGRSWRLWLEDPIAQAAHETVGSGRLKAPMPSAVVEVLVAPGDRVQRNQPLVVLEAMKMEHVVRSPGAGVVTAIHCAAREKVAEGADVITLELAPT
jgi:3-methylcrotonyl-CoA carboxylase alpha subunit